MSTLVAIVIQSPFYVTLARLTSTMTASRCVAIVVAATRHLLIIGAHNIQCRGFRGGRVYHQVHFEKSFNNETKPIIEAMLKQAIVRFLISS
jgi:hypothetical protein